MLFWACFSEFLGAFEGVPGGLLEHFFVNKREFKDFGNTSKSMAGAVFSRSRHPGGREKVTKRLLEFVGRIDG